MEISIYLARGEPKMKKIICVGILALAAAAWATNPIVVELPKLTQPPVLDGFMGANEWKNALEQDCSPSIIMQWGAEYGWRDQAAFASEVGVNQLNLNDTAGESAAEAKTDADYSSQVFVAWDDEALWYVIQARDNYNDVEGTGTPTNWWERDGMTLYIDLVNSRENIGCCTYTQAKMNLIKYDAAPKNSSSVTITWERIVQDTRTPTQDPTEIELMDYAFRDAEEEFGSSVTGADYVIEAKVPWAHFLKGGLPAMPAAGTEMGWMWLAPDPDASEGYGGQIQCWGWGDLPVDYTTIIFTDTPAGPDGTAVESDSWGRIKATF